MRHILLDSILKDGKIKLTISTFISLTACIICEHYSSNILAKKRSFHANKPIGNKTDEV